MFGLGKRRERAERIDAQPVSPALHELAVLDVKVAVDEQICHHCGACVAVCPPDAIFLETMRLVIHQDICTSCERCVKMCPVHALSMPNGRQPGRSGGPHA